MLQSGQRRCPKGHFLNQQADGSLEGNDEYFQPRHQMNKVQADVDKIVFKFIFSYGI